jgi:hypothetical protein
MGTTEDQETQFSPHQSVSDIYYVAQMLASFRRDPQGNILIDTTSTEYPVIRKSVEQLRFKFSTSRSCFRQSRAQRSHEGDAMVKQLTGAQVMAMAEDAGASGHGPAARPCRQGPPRWRVGDPWWHDARRAPDSGSYPRRNDLDDQSAEGGKTYDVVSSAACARGAVSRHCGRIDPVCAGARTAGDVPRRSPGACDMDTVTPSSSGGPGRLSTKRTASRSNIQETMYHAVIGGRNGRQASASFRLRDQYGLRRIVRGHAVSNNFEPDRSGLIARRPRMSLALE